MFLAAVMCTKQPDYGLLGDHSVGCVVELVRFRVDGVFWFLLAALEPFAGLLPWGFSTGFFFCAARFIRL